MLPKLNHTGGSDDAPNAWRNILRHAAELGLNIDLEKRIVGVDSENLFDHPFVFIHGRNDFFYHNAETKLLAKYLEGGNRGFIFADAICSSGNFQAAFEKQMGRVFPGQTLEPIPADHPMWTNQFGGFDLRTVTMTKPDRTKSDGVAKQKISPQFKGIEINGRYAVVYSPFDLSCALENTAYSNCEGYTREDAIKLGINVLLYRLHAD